MTKTRKEMDEPVPERADKPLYRQELQKRADLKS